MSSEIPFHSINVGEIVGAPKISQCLGIKGLVGIGQVAVLYVICNI